MKTSPVCFGGRDRACAQASVSSCVPLARVLFTISPKWRACSQATRDNTFGSFVVPSSGKLVSVKLVHVYGYVTCDKRNRAYWSFWGCCHYPKDVNVVITTSFDKILLPSNEFFTGLVLRRFLQSWCCRLSPILQTWLEDRSSVCGTAKIWRMALKATMEEHRAAMFMFEQHGKRPKLRLGLGCQ